MRIRKFILSMAVVMIGVTATGAGPTRQQYAAAGDSSQQDKARAADSNKKESDEIEFFAAQAQSAPPEFAADILLRIVESGGAINNASKVGLLKDAFSLASTVQHPVKRRSLPGALADTRSGYLSKAFGLGFDRLSLQCRAVKAMLAIDKQVARELFEQIPKLKLQPINCEDALVYDVAEYYATLANVALAAFSKKEVARGDNVRFMELRLRAIESPAQVGPAAHALVSQRVSAAQLDSLVHAYSQALGNVSYDDRSFYNSIATGSFLQGIEAVIAECKKGGISRDELLGAIRRYLINGANSVKCADVPTAKGQRNQYASIIEYFNTDLRFANLPSKREIAPIAEEDIKPPGTTVTAETYSYWQSPKAKALLARIKRLRFGSGRTELSEVDKEKPEWQSMLTDYLNDLATWDPEEEKAEPDYFHQKSVIFRSLVEVSPPGPVRDRVVRDYITFLSYSKLQQTDAIEWFLHVRYVLEKASESQGEGRDKILDAMSKSSSATMYSYARLERLLPQTKDKIL